MGGATAYDVASAFIKVRPSALAEVFNDRVVLGGLVNGAIVVRADGVGFGKALRKFASPRDESVHKALLAAAEDVMRRFSAAAAHVVSDEVNILLLSPPYSGRVFKIVSVIASMLSARVSLELNTPLYFDARVLGLKSAKEFVPYTLYRVRVGVNNFVSKLYHGALPKNVTPKLEEMVRVLKSRLVKWPAWACGGTLISWSLAIKEGVNPITGEHVRALRRVLVKHDVVNPEVVIRAVRESISTLSLAGRGTHGQARKKEVGEVTE